MNTMIPSLFLVLKSTTILCQLFVPVGNGVEEMSADSSAASRITTMGVLALLNFSVRA